jgi:hypothetical protein
MEVFAQCLRQYVRRSPLPVRVLAEHLGCSVFAAMNARLTASRLSADEATHRLEVAR